jgi:hypothetical protein
MASKAANPFASDVGAFRQGGNQYDGHAENQNQGN